jgi:hypothetical protein
LGAPWAPPDEASTLEAARAVKRRGMVEVLGIVVMETEADGRIFEHCQSVYVRDGRECSLADEQVCLMESRRVGF